MSKYYCIVIIRCCSSSNSINLNCREQEYNHQWLFKGALFSMSLSKGAIYWRKYIISLGFCKQLWALRVKVVHVHYDLKKMSLASLNKCIYTQAVFLKTFFNQIIGHSEIQLKRRSNIYYLILPTILKWYHNICNILSSSTKHCCTIIMNYLLSFEY